MLRQRAGEPATLDSRTQWTRGKLKEILRCLPEVEDVSRTAFLKALWNHLYVRAQFSDDAIKNLAGDDFSNLAKEFIDHGIGKFIGQHTNGWYPRPSEECSLQHTVCDLIRLLATERGREYSHARFSSTHAIGVNQRSNVGSENVDKGGISANATRAHLHTTESTPSRSQRLIEPEISVDATQAVEEEVDQITVRSEPLQQRLDGSNSDMENIEHGALPDTMSPFSSSREQLQARLAHQSTNDEQGQRPGAETNFIVEMPAHEPVRKTTARATDISYTRSPALNTEISSSPVQNNHRSSRKRLHDVIYIDDGASAGSSNMHQTPQPSPVQSPTVERPRPTNNLSSDRRVRQCVEAQFAWTQPVVGIPLSSSTLPPTPPPSVQIGHLPPPPSTGHASSSRNNHNNNSNNQQRPFLARSLSDLPQIFLSYLRHCQKQHRIASNDPRFCLNRNYHNQYVEWLKRFEEDLESRVEALTSPGAARMLTGGGGGDASAAQRVMGLSFNCHPNYGFDLEPGCGGF